MEPFWWFVRILWLLIVIVAVHANNHHKYPLPVVINQILDVKLACDHRTLNATLNLQYPFKGLLFAKDFSHECNALGDLSTSISISLPTSGCGVRLVSRSLDSTKLIYSVVLVAQQDRHLRQIADQETLLECVVEEDAFTIQSASLTQVILNDLEERRDRRTGRMRNDKELEQSLAAARAWMEIVPEEMNASGERESLQVGEAAVLKVKSTLPAGIGWKVVDCLAHDGLGDASQKLLDEDGCPIDSLLLPVPELGPVQAISIMKHQEATSRFAAFKFPDRDRLHLACRMELCRGYCQEIDCENRNETRLARDLSKGKAGEILDRLEIFNSVEVKAPAIDDLRKDERLLDSGDPFSDSFKHLPGDRTFCVSPEKVAVTFCILGMIFLTGVVISTLALIRTRKQSADGLFYTRSLFSSSSGGSGYGSKLLTQDSSSSPCMGQSSSSGRGGMPYGRIL